MNLNLLSQQYTGHLICADSHGIPNNG